MDVVFDLCIGQISIKYITRTGNERLIRKVIDSKDVGLPQICPQFLLLRKIK